MNPGQNPFKGRMGIDPVYEALSLCAMRESLGFPDEQRGLLAALEERGKVLVSAHASPSDWAEYYGDLLDAARDAVVRLENCVKAPGPGCDAGYEIPTATSLSRLKGWLKEIKDSDHDAVNYVVNHRIPTQRAHEIREAIEACAAGCPLSERVDQGMLFVEISDESFGHLKGDIQEVFAKWKEHVLTGLVARMNKGRQEFLDLMSDDLRAVGGGLPEPVCVMKGPPQTIRLTPSISQKLASWPKLAWQSFRSWMVVVSMLASVLVSTIFMFIPGGGAAGSFSQRGVLYLCFLPPIAVVAVVCSIVGRRKDRRERAANLEIKLRSDLENSIQKLADQAMKDIDGAAKKVQFETDQAMKVWSLKLEKQHAQKHAAAAPAVAAGPANAHVASPGQIQTMLTRLKTRLIPGIEARLSAITAAGPGE